MFEALTRRFDAATQAVARLDGAVPRAEAKATLAEAVAHAGGRFIPRRGDSDYSRTGEVGTTYDARSFNHLVNREAHRTRRGQSGINWGHLKAIRNHR